MENKRVETIQNRLYELMQIKGINATKLSEITGISRPVLSRYLNGQREPRQDKIGAIAEACDISPAWLMGYDVKMHEPLTKQAAADDNELLKKWALLGRHEKYLIMGIIDGYLKK